MIKSKLFIFKGIFNYIKDENFLYKLIKYSKKTQRQLNISKDNYIIRYFHKIGLKTDLYINYYYDFFNCRYQNIEKDGFDKDILYRNLKTDFSKYKFDMILLAKYIYFEYKNFNGAGYGRQFPIDIYSPFLFYLSKAKKFDEIFFIPISAKTINDFNLKDDYIKVFKQLYLYNSPKKLTPYLNVYFNYQNDNDIQYLADFKIFSKIKRLSLEKQYAPLTNEMTNYDNFFKLLFSPKNIKSNNLVYLDIQIETSYQGISAKIVENLNKFKLIKHLKLQGFDFNETFYLKLKQLESLYLESCQYITFYENFCSNLEEINLLGSQIVKSKSLLNFNKLKILKGAQTFYDIINLKSLEKLQNFDGTAYDFIFLENQFLEEITLSSIKNYSQEIEQKMINKIISMKSLKEVSIPIEYFSNDNTQNIKEYNYSVKDLTIHSKNHDDDDFDGFHISKYLANLLTLRIYGENKNNNKERIIKIEKEDDYSNLEDIYLYLNNFGCKLYIPYEKIKTFTYNENGENKVSFKFNKYNYIFKSLNKYKGTFRSPFYLETIDNIFNNKNKVPKLKIFTISGTLKNKINEDLYSNFIKKLLELKNLETIEIIIEIIEENNEEDIFDCFKTVKFRNYSEKELKDLFPNLDYKKYKSISISNLDSPIPTSI